MKTPDVLKDFVSHKPPKQGNFCILQGCICRRFGGLNPFVKSLTSSPTTTRKICAFFFTGLDRSRLTNLDRSRFEKERNQSLHCGSTTHRHDEDDFRLKLVLSLNTCLCRCPRYGRVVVRDCTGGGRLGGSRHA